MRDNHMGSLFLASLGPNTSTSTTRSFCGHRGIAKKIILRVTWQLMTKWSVYSIKVRVQIKIVIQKWQIVDVSKKIIHKNPPFALLVVLRSGLWFYILTQHELCHIIFFRKTSISFLFIAGTTRKIEWKRLIKR